VTRVGGKDVVRLQSEVAVQRLVEARGVELHSKGKLLVGGCPLHRGASKNTLSIDPKANTWNCPTCGNNLTVIDWVQKAEGISRRPPSSCSSRACL
jgi:CHC2 zinc finger